MGEIDTSTYKVPKNTPLDEFRLMQECLEHGCADGYCVIERTRGQHTNGGCRCLYHPDHITLQRVGHMLRAAQAMADDMIPALTAERDAAVLRAEQAEARERALLSASEEARQFLRRRDAMQAEIDRLREFERRTVSDGMLNASRYWEERWRDEAADNERLREALTNLIPQNLGAVPVSVPDSTTVPVDMTIGEIRRARAAIAASEQANG